MNRYQQTHQIKENYRAALRKANKEWPPNIQQALIFMNAHLFDSRLTVAWMKGRCGIYHKSFSNHFRLHLHRYPKKYILHHRINAAKKIMQQTEVTITTTAVLIGFTSSSSFTNSFKAWEDITPTQWRKQN